MGCDVWNWSSHPATIRRQRRQSEWGKPRAMAWLGGWLIQAWNHLHLLYEKRERHFQLGILSLIAKSIQTHTHGFVGAVYFGLGWVNILINGWRLWYFSFSSQLCCLVIEEFLSQVALWINIVFHGLIGSSFGHCRSPIRRWRVWKQKHSFF